jgi:hypothetical protein
MRVEVRRDLILEKLFRKSRFRDSYIFTSIGFQKKSIVFDPRRLFRDLQTNETQGAGFEQQCFNKSTLLFG